MEIEILTTKKKLSKNTVKQLDPANIGDLSHFNNMPTYGFYIRDLGAKYPPRVLLFEGINGWKIIGCREWHSSGDSRVEASAREIGSRGCSVKDFSSRHVRDIWIREYDKLKNSCLKNHLII